jgi:formate hydrogenlyase subunit 6/NADH:ubiquinone oxidoreductase subunit I
MCVYCGICADTCPTHCLHFHSAHRPAATERQMISMQGEPKAKKKSKTD